MLAARGTVTPAVLLSVQEAHSHVQLRLNLEPAARCGAPRVRRAAAALPRLAHHALGNKAPVPQDALADVPLYVHAKEVRLPDGGLDAVELT